MKKLRQIVLPPEILESLLPAIKHNKTGKLVIGKRGDYHSDLFLKTNPPKGMNFSGNLSAAEMDYFRSYDRGYYDTKNKKYLTRKQAGGIDSQELRSPITQFREDKKPRTKKALRD